MPEGVQQLRIALVGATGRLGSEIRTAIEADPQSKLAFALVRPHGSRPDGIACFEDLQNADIPFDVLVDVALAENFETRLRALVATGKPLVTGVTGLNPDQQSALQQAAKHVSVLQAANFSQGVTALLAQVRDTAKRLGSAWKVEISETHHVHKKDYPSGTALALANAVQDGLGRNIPIVSALWPETPKVVQDPFIAVQSYRKAEVFGAHEVCFSSAHEQVVLGHTAQSRAVFAQGALAAAKWIMDKPAGFYGMEDLG